MTTPNFHIDKYMLTNDTEHCHSFSVAFPVWKNGEYFYSFATDYDTKKRCFVINDDMRRVCGQDIGAFEQYLSMIDVRVNAYQDGSSDLHNIHAIKTIQKKDGYLSVSGVFIRPYDVTMFNHNTNLMLRNNIGYQNGVDILVEDTKVIEYKNVSVYISKEDEDTAGLQCKVLTHCRSSSFMTFPYEITHELVKQGIPMPEFFEGQPVFLPYGHVKELFRLSLPFVKRMACKNKSTLWKLPPDLLTPILGKLHGNTLRTIPYDEVVNYYLSHHLAIPDEVSRRFNRQQPVQTEIEVYL